MFRTERPPPGARTGSCLPVPAQPAPIPRAKSRERKTAARISSLYYRSHPNESPVAWPDVRPLFGPGDFFDEVGVAMARVGKVRVPATRRAEYQLDLARVAGGDRTANHLGARGDGLAAHGTNKSRRGGHQPNHLPRQRRRRLPVVVRRKAARGHGPPRRKTSGWARTTARATPAGQPSPT